MKTALGGSSSVKDNTTAPRVMVRLSWNQGISPDGYVVTLQYPSEACSNGSTV